MPKYDTPSGQDALDKALNDIAALQNRIQVLEGRRLSTWDRFNHADIAAPTEGQHVVEHDTESVWYFSNGEWRELTAHMPYAFMYESTNESLPTATSRSMPFSSWAPVEVESPFDGTDLSDQYCESHPEVISVLDSTSGSFLVHEPGIYLVQAAGRYTGGAAITSDQIEIGSPNSYMPWSSFNWNPGPTAASLLDLYKVSVLPMFDINGSFDQITFTWRQTSGSTQTVEYNWAFIVQLCKV